jgi:hypothetical protein
MRRRYESEESEKGFIVHDDLRFELLFFERMTFGGLRF